MGWKSFTIVINSSKEVDPEKLLTDLGFKDLKISSNDYFESAIYPDEGKVYFGKYKNVTIITSQNLALSFLEESASKAEKVLHDFFPDSEICALILQGVVNLWGFSISKNYKKLRVKGGSSDTGTMVDYGEPLPEELPILSKSCLDINKKRIYSLEDFPNETLTEDQMGEEFVFRVSQRYLGTRLDDADELLFETEFQGFDHS